MCPRYEKVLTGGQNDSVGWIIACCLVGNSGSLRPCRGAAVFQVGCLPPHTPTQHAVRKCSQRTAAAERALLQPPIPVSLWRRMRRRQQRHDGTAHHNLNTPPPPPPPLNAAAAGLSNATEEVQNFEASRMFCSDGTLSAVTYALLLGITCLTVLCDLTKGSSDFSGGGESSLGLFSISDQHLL